MQALVSVVGVIAMLGIGWLLSSNRGAINRRTVAVAVALQTSIAALVLYVPQGGQALGVAVRGVQHVINYAKDGIKFVFGENFEENLGFTVALNVLPVIVFIGAMMSVLYYLGIMQRVVGTLGGWLHKLLGTSHPESISAVSNIFVGHTDAPLVVRPSHVNVPEPAAAGLLAAAFCAAGFEAGFVEGGIRRHFPVMAQIGCPIDKQLFVRLVHDTQRNVAAGLKLLAVLIGHLVRLDLTDNTLSDKLIDVQCMGGGV